MNKNELVRAMANNAGITLKDAAVALDALLDAVTEGLKNGEKIQISGFGSFEMKEKTETFNYTYSAQQQQEIRLLRQKYTAPEETKLDLLRKLDLRATQKAQAWAIALGVLGALIMGTGMSLAMTELSGFLGGTAMFIGIPVGLIGIALVALAYPMYRRILKQKRQKIAPEILRLTEELLK